MGDAFINAGGKFFICTTPQPNDLTKEQFEALTWVEVKNVGSFPESGITSNIVKYDTADTDVSQKAKGVSDASGGSLELARVDTDPGQIALRAAAATKFKYATKRELTDAPSADYTNTIYYNRGVIAGPVHAGGRVEDFILETFNFGNVQREVVVGPVSQVAPTNTVKPAISGVAQTGVQLTAYPGIWTGGPSFAYQWQKDTGGNGTYADIAGATSAAYTPLVGNVGNSLRVKVTGTNGAGSVPAYSAGTLVQIGA
jgi:hypothetical protein